MRFEEIVERFLKRVDGEVTEKKIKEYFTELFENEMETEEDMEEMNLAEKYLEEFFL